MKKIAQYIEYTEVFLESFIPTIAGIEAAFYYHGEKINKAIFWLLLAGFVILIGQTGAYFRNKDKS